MYGVWRSWEFLRDVKNTAIPMYNSGGWDVTGMRPGMGISSGGVDAASTAGREAGVT
jgi:hypothetical protein